MGITYDDALTPLVLQDIKQSEFPEIVLANQPSFKELMMQYECAIMEVSTKLNVLNQDFSVAFQRNPIESIKTRVKSPASIIEKLARRNQPLSIDSMENYLTDIAGIRVICPFVDDIYIVAKLLTEQDDVELVLEKDYIKEPKENGYRSLHLIVKIPIFLSTGKIDRYVEIQLRTIAMDFWANLDHRLQYKHNLKNQDEIVAELKECAEAINEVDCRMLKLRKKIQ